jgi:hypothetical protein
MKPLQLMRKLFGFTPLETEVSDEDMVILVYQEFTKLQANLQIHAAVQQALNPKKEETDGQIQPEQV